MGLGNTVTSPNSGIALGQFNTVSGSYSLAIGQSNIASGNHALSIGNIDTANGSYSQALGIGNYAYSYGEFVAGSYAARYTPTSATTFDRRDRIFSIGIGTGSATANRSNAFTILKNGRSGFNTTTPAARVDVNGDIALRQKTLTLATGANSDITAVDTMTFYRITGPTGAFNVTGFTGGVDGRVLILYNTTTQPMTITNLATSGAANQINTLSANLVTVGEGSVTLTYDATSSKWIVLSFTP